MKMSSRFLTFIVKNERIFALQKLAKFIPWGTLLLKILTD